VGGYGVGCGICVYCRAVFSQSHFVPLEKLRRNYSKNSRKRKSTLSLLIFSQLEQSSVESSCKSTVTMNVSQKPLWLDKL